MYSDTPPTAVDNLANRSLQNISETRFLYKRIFLALKHDVYEMGRRDSKQLHPSSFNFPTDIFFFEKSC